MNYPENLPMLSYAAQRKRDQLLSKILERSTRVFLQKMNFKQGMTGIDLGCGIGDITLQLQSKIGAEGKMTGIGLSSTHIEIAKEMALIKSQSNIEFVQQNIPEWQETEKYDFVYSRLLFSQLSQPLNVMGQIFRSLKKGGFAMIEEVDLSMYHSYPSCYAFKRYTELVTRIQEQQGVNTNIGQQLELLFQQSNFEDIQVQTIKSSFLAAAEKQIPSLILECLSDKLIAKQLTTTTELQALILELKVFEQKTDTLIGISGGYQVYGYKPVHD